MKKLIYTGLTLCLLMGGSSSALAADSPSQMSAPAQQTQAGSCTGTIYDEEGDPMIGASVLVKGTKIATATDIEGRFTLPGVKTGSTIIVSYVGYQPVSLVWNGKPIQVHMTPSNNTLDDVVVVAYGTQKKSSITGSISQVNSESIELRPVTSVTSALEGTTSGITVSGNYGEAGGEPTIRIRGIGTINGASSTPLYVIDGVPFGGNISDLNPNDIESMSVLKDASSTALYGNRASNGVILITTKSAKGTDKMRINVKVNQGWYNRALPEYDTTNPAEFMQASFLNLYNNRMVTSGSDYADPAAVAAGRQFAANNIISTYTYVNPFDVENDQLFDENGNFNPAAKIKAGYLGDLDWWDQALRTGNRGEYLISAMGASKNADYMFSVGYLNEEGYMRDNDFKRITGRANVNMQPTKWFKTGFNISASHQKIHGTMNGVGDGSSSYNNAFWFCRYISPIYPVHIHDVNTGEYILSEQGEKQYDPGYYIQDGQQINTRNQSVNRNVIYESIVNTRQQIRNTMNGTAYMDIILPYGLTFKLQGNLNTRTDDSFNYSSALIGDAVDVGGIDKTIYTRKNFTVMEQLLWNYTFNDVHHFNAILGHENYENRYDYTFARKRDQAFEGVTNLSNFSTMNNVSGYKQMHRLESFLARVQYNYNDKYNVEASFRRDGTSRFAKDVRWGNFGSVGANWVFSNEEFMKDVKWLNNGKLFANWGQVGNDSGVSSYYAYYTLYTSSTNNSLPAYYLSQLAAMDLKWETSESWGIGVEGWLFDRWHLSLEYYDKTNKDLIFGVNAPASAGSTSTSGYGATVTKNIGTISNRGIEISTDVDVYRDKDWTFNIGLNFSTLQNKVIKLPEEYKKPLTDEATSSILTYNQQGDLMYANKSRYNGYASDSYLISEGHSRYDWYLAHWEGVDQMTGNSLYTPNLELYYIKQEDGTILGGLYDKDGNLDLEHCQELKPANYTMINGKYYVTNTTYAQRDFRGSALPTVQGSVSASLKYKGLRLSALLTYSLGGKVLDGVYQDLMSTTGTPRNMHVDILNSWCGIPEGMTEDSPNRITTDINPAINYGVSSYNNATTDRFLVSRNYWCLKNVNLSYDLPRSLLRRIDLQGLTVSFSAENLYNKTARRGMNPMMGIGGGQSNYLVPARVFTFGLSLTI